MPVALAVDVPKRPPAAVEQAAYFVVSEALVNVAKRADAGHVSVHVTVAGGWLRLEVVDDGPVASSGPAPLERAPRAVPRPRHRTLVLRIHG